MLRIAVTLCSNFLHLVTSLQTPLVIQRCYGVTLYVCTHLNSFYQKIWRLCRRISKVSFFVQVTSGLFPFNFLSVLAVHILSWLKIMTTGAYRYTLFSIFLCCTKWTSNFYSPLYKSFSSPSQITLRIKINSNQFLSYFLGWGMGAWGREEFEQPSTLTWSEDRREPKLWHRNNFLKRERVVRILQNEGYHKVCSFLIFEWRPFVSTKWKIFDAKYAKGKNSQIKRP